MRWDEQLMLYDEDLSDIYHVTISFLRFSFTLYLLCLNGYDRMDQQEKDFM